MVKNLGIKATIVFFLNRKWSSATSVTHMYMLQTCSQTGFCLMYYLRVRGIELYTYCFFLFYILPPLRLVWVLPNIYYIDSSSCRCPLVGYRFLPCCVFAQRLKCCVSDISFLRLPRVFSGLWSLWSLVAVAQLPSSQEKLEVERRIFLLLFLLLLTPLFTVLADVHFTTFKKAIFEAKSARCELKQRPFITVDDYISLARNTDIECHHKYAFFQLHSAL